MAGRGAPAAGLPGGERPALIFGLSAKAASLWGLPSISIATGLLTILICFLRPLSSTQAATTRMRILCFPGDNWGGCGAMLRSFQMPQAPGSSTTGRPVHSACGSNRAGFASCSRVQVSQTPGYPSYSSSHDSCVRPSVNPYRTWAGGPRNTSRPSQHPSPIPAPIHRKWSIVQPAAAQAGWVFASNAKTWLTSGSWRPFTASRHEHGADFLLVGVGEATLFQQMHHQLLGRPLEDPVDQVLQETAPAVSLAQGRPPSFPGVRISRRRAIAMTTWSPSFKPSVTSDRSLWGLAGFRAYRTSTPGRGS